MQNIRAISCLCEIVRPVFGVAFPALVCPASVERSQRAVWWNREGRGVEKDLVLREDTEAVGRIPHSGKKSGMSAKTVPHHWSHCAKDNSPVYADRAQWRRSLGWGCRVPAWEPGPPGGLVLAQHRAARWLRGGQ